MNGTNEDNGAEESGNGSLPPIIEAWTSEMLRDYKPHRPRKRQDDGDSTIAFGRSTKKSLTPTPHFTALKNPLSSSSNMPMHQRGRRSRISMKGNSADDTATTTSVTSSATGAFSNASSSTRRLRLSGQEAKHIRRQMFTSANGPETLAKAQEKRRRQLTYSQEIRHAASAGSKSSVSLQIDSITRVVVQSFRKLINCERCALFLMDHKRDQLYFKPVGDPTGSGSRQEQVIRFSASKGVAGWVATNRSMLNIKNAYADKRFNQEIDKQTNFRTRTILCVPVLDSSGNKVLGVIQMVNKLVEDGKAKQKKAKHTKSDDTHHGYLEVYETFSTDDEETLEKCARQVSNALEEVLGSSTLGSQGEKDNPIVGSSGGESIEAAYNTYNSKDKVGDKAEDEASSSSVDSSSSESSNESETANEMGAVVAEDLIRSPIPVGIASPADGRRRSSAARRSSIASLVQFVSSAQTIQKAGKEDQEGNGANTGKNETVADVGISEALQRFQFRSASGRQISNRRGSMLAENPEFVAAETKRKRMEEYNTKRKSLGS